MAEPKPVVLVTVLGEKLELLLPGYGWTYKEAKLAKAESEGMTPHQIGLNFLEGDPDATMAILRVSFSRAGRVLSQVDLEQLRELDLEVLGQEVADAIEAAWTTSPTRPATAGEQTANSAEESESGAARMEPTASASDGRLLSAI